MSQFKLDEKTKKTIVRQHEGIIKAIKKRDKKEAYEKMKKHVLDVHKMHEELEEG
jgi:DNA-binding GntR family transcriptional regulator